MPGHVDVTVPRMTESGKELRVACRSDVPGHCLIELTCERGQFTFDPEPRTKFDGTHAGMRALSDVYRRANDDCYARHKLDGVSESFETTLKIPEHVTGACLIRVFVQGAKAAALGAASVYVE